MRGKKAKRLRRERVEAGLPAFAPPVHNITDLEDTHADRRLKTRHPRRYAAEMRESDPQRIMADRRKWSIVMLYLTAPITMKPYLERFDGDPGQEDRQAAWEAHLEELQGDIEKWDLEREEAMS